MIFMRFDIISLIQAAGQGFIMQWDNFNQKQIKQMKGHMKEGNRIWDYEILQQLGRGEYGQVYKVKNKKNGMTFALKKVNIASSHEKEKIQAFREVKALKLIHHPDIIEYYESFLSMENIYIVMEYASKGDFSKIIRERKAKEKPFAEHELWIIFGALISGVKYLHEKGIMHRDIKAENIFMTESGRVKLGDLGMSKVVHDEQKFISTRVGTPAYFAPEVIQNQLYSFGVDIWALGCIFYYLATLEHPFKDATIETLPYYVIQKDPKPIKGQYSGYLINFIAHLMNKNPKERPNIHEVNNEYKNKDNPNPINKVLVYDIKKLLLMKPNIQQLEQLEKNYQIKENASQHKIHQKELRTYKDYLKFNQSTDRITKKNLLQEHSPIKQQPITSRYHSTSYHFPSRRKHISNNPQPSEYTQCHSPIKTSGFSQFINTKPIRAVKQIKSSSIFDSMLGSNTVIMKQVQKGQVVRRSMLRYASRKNSVM